MFMTRRLRSEQAVLAQQECRSATFSKSRTRLLDQEWLRCRLCINLFVQGILKPIILAPG